MKKEEISGRELLLSCSQLGKTYKNGDAETVALSQVNMEVAKGEFIAIMGASGSGKSTLLNILGCMDSATSGEYQYGDVLVSDLSGEKLHRFRKDHISFVFQSFALLPRYTVYENVEIPLLAQNVKKKERHQRIMTQLELLGIADLADKLPIHISGGQQQRCGIARALVSEHELLLADEPTGALDRKTGEELMQVLTNLNQAGKTIIMVTHDLEVAGYADRILRIADGSICS